MTVLTPFGPRFAKGHLFGSRFCHTACMSLQWRCVCMLMVKVT